MKISRCHFAELPSRLVLPTFLSLFTVLRSLSRPRRCFLLSVYLHRHFARRSPLHSWFLRRSGFSVWDQCRQCQHHRRFNNVNHLLLPLRIWTSPLWYSSFHLMDYGFDIFPYPFWISKFGYLKVKTEWMKWYFN